MQVAAHALCKGDHVIWVGPLLEHVFHVQLVRTLLQRLLFPFLFYYTLIQV